MQVALLHGFCLKVTLLTLILGAQALPQWLKGLRRDAAYAPAAYNPVYGPRDGAAGYTYIGYGPLPTVVTTSFITSSTTSSSEVSETTIVSSEVLTRSGLTSLSITLPSAFETLSNGLTHSSPSISHSTVKSSSYAELIATASSDASLSYNIISALSAPLICSHDNCLRQFLREPAVTSFCRTYTTAQNNFTTKLPAFVSHCSGLPSRISSACSCLPTPTFSASISLEPSLSLNRTILPTGSLSIPSPSVKTTATISATSGVEPTTTSTTHVTITSPITVWYTPTAQMGTGSSSIHSSLPETSAPYQLSNRTSLAASSQASPTSYATSPLSSAIQPISSILGTGGVNSSTVLSISSTPYPMSNATSGIDATGSSYGTAPETTSSDPSSYGIPTNTPGHYQTGKSSVIAYSGASTSYTESGSVPSSSSGGDPYFPMSNSSSIFGTAPTATGSIKEPLSTPTSNSLVSSSSPPYYPTGNSSSFGGLSGTFPAPSATSNLVPIYPTGNYSVNVSTTSTTPTPSGSTGISGSSTEGISPISYRSTSYYSASNSTSATGPVGTGNINPDSSSAVAIQSSIPPYYVSSNSSSFFSTTGTSLPRASGETVTATSPTTASDNGVSPYTTGTSGPIPSSASSFELYSISTSPTTTSTTSTSITSPTILTMPVYALPTRHEGDLDHDSEQDQHEDEVDIFFT